MLIKDNGGGMEFEQAPTGAHVGICVRIVDLGTQKNDYQGQVTYKRQGLFTWELPAALMTTSEQAGKPFLVSKFYTLSLNEKATLRKDLAAWRGRDFTPEELAGFDPKAVLGKACMLNLISNAKGKTVINGLMQLPKGLPVSGQTNPSVYFSLEAFDQKVFESLSKGVKEMIERSPEYQKLKMPDYVHEPVEFDDIKDDIVW